MGKLGRFEFWLESVIDETAERAETCFDVSYNFCRHLVSSAAYTLRCVLYLVIFLPIIWLYRWITKENNE